jgi:hypothetical protein
MTETFLFEVSPSKTINCCPKGFYGMPVEFHYDGDATRFNNCPTELSMEAFPSKTSNYQLLGNTYGGNDNDVMESFQHYDHLQINPANYDTLDSAYNGSGRFFNPVKQGITKPNIWGCKDSPVTESFCGSCAL